MEKVAGAGPLFFQTVVGKKKPLRFDDGDREPVGGRRAVNAPMRLCGEGMMALEAVGVGAEAVRCPLAECACLSGW